MLNLWGQQDLSPKPTSLTRCFLLCLASHLLTQLYQKSREESSGEGSGVEILANRPYSDGPGGSGQYTHKIYHVGSHIPSWFRALLPKAALQVEEESWNAYPYTRTRYTCPFVEKFSIEIETYYRPDAGQQTNVFNLMIWERHLYTIDIVRDPISPGEYKPEEDPKLYHSAKTGRGPLGDDWLEAAAGGPLMCAYKLCKVEFRYWGMQSKIEQFIHDVGLRKVMLRAHRQAWCWQDEWTDLTMEDIRQLEEETMGAVSFLQGGSAESAAQTCRIHALFLILHSGNILDQGVGEPGSKQADVQTLAATFDAVTRVHFPEALGHVALRLVPCPPICAAAYALVSK
uniref:Phosphatidylinositol transfer protein membrane associated 1 n=1 Tax=Anas platyrhynchos platyrhynchos TaxID=8840 RepID=A0A493U2D6_ANAPP